MPPDCDSGGFFIFMEWISVKERVPVNRDIVLVANVDSKHKSDQWVCAGQLNEQGEWSNQFVDDDTILVTHWMPLPEPPKSNG